MEAECVVPFSVKCADSSVDEEYCVVQHAQAGDPSSSIMIYRVDESRLTIIWLMESPGREELRTQMDNEVTGKA